MQYKICLLFFLLNMIENLVRNRQEFRFPILKQRRYDDGFEVDWESLTEWKLRQEIGEYLLQKTTMN